MIDLDAQRPSTASLLSETFSKTIELLSAELQLVRVELAEKIGVAVKSIVGIVVAAVFLIVAMIILLQGVVAVLIEHGWSASMSSFAVGGAIALLALIAIAVAARNLSSSALRPDRSLRQLHGPAALAKEKAA